ncbi:MAG: RDD family protein [Chloroflexi bacterium]|nr:RDD family protein [Chloroflexota bacterium]
MKEDETNGLTITTAKIRRRSDMAREWYFKLMGAEVGPVSSSELLRRVDAGEVTFDSWVRMANTDWMIADTVLKRKWFYKSSENVVGPISSVDLWRLADSGAIRQDTWVRPSDGAWTQASGVKGLLVVPVSDSERKPAPLRATGVRRAIGYSVDMWLVGIAATLLAVPFVEQVNPTLPKAEVANACFAGFLLPFYWFFECIWGRTPGKLVANTKVVGMDGAEPAEAWRVALRAVIRFVPFEPLSYFFSSPPGNMWHDTWTKTRVVKWPPVYQREGNSTQLRELQT